MMKDAGRLLFEDYSLYDTHHVVFSHPTISPKELQRWQTDGHDRFYTRSKALRRLLRGRIAGAAVTHYARRINRGWARANAGYLATLECLGTPVAGADSRRTDEAVQHGGGGCSR